MKLKSVFDASEIKSEFESAGINPKFAIQIWKYVIQNPDCVWDEIPSLPSAAYSLLHSKFKTLTSSLHSLFHSSDGTTSKLLIKLQVLYTLLLYTTHCFYGFWKTCNVSVSWRTHIGFLLLVLKLKNGAFVEAVVMRYDTRLGMLGGKPRPGGIRSTLCISSQVLIFITQCYLGFIEWKTCDVKVFINRLVVRWVAHSVLLVPWDLKAI